MDLLARFEKKYEPVTESGCWIWTGSLNEHGYGGFHLRGKTTKAHRVAWLLYRGEFPKLPLLHKCDVPCCVNPAHLFFGTQKDNAQDAIAKGRAGYYQEKLIETCRKGHLYDHANTMVRFRNGSISRQCRKCFNDRRRITRRRGYTP